MKKDKYIFITPMGTENSHFYKIWEKNKIDKKKLKEFDKKSLGVDEFKKQYLGEFDLINEN